VKRIVFIVLLAICLSGCSESTPKDKSKEVLKKARISYKYYCQTPEQKSCMIRAAIGCAEAANPKSDEEPEDWLPKCKELAEEGCCPYTKGVVYSGNYVNEWIPWSEVPEEHKRILEAEHRYVR